MEVLSLGWRTDLAILALAGAEIVHRPTYVVVRTPANPTYRWGNFLLLRRTPLRLDLPMVEELFTRELPGIAHRAFGIDVPDGGDADLRPFADLGFTTMTAAVMTARALRPPPRPNTAARFRRLESDDDWAQRVDLDLAVDGEVPGFEEFARRKAASERQLTRDGLGSWYGAFDDGRLVATMGVVRAHDGLGRFQQVQTHPETRGRGLAGTLAHVAGTDALDHPDIDTLVTVADRDYHAIRVYASIGFTDTETQLQAERLGR